MAAGSWSTDNLPAAVRAEAACTMLSEVHLPWSLDPRDRQSFGCRLAWGDMGACTLIECHTRPIAGSRGRAEIHGTEGEYFGLLLVLSGRERVRQGETAVSLGAGDLVLWDGAAPLDFEVAAPLHKLTLLIPRSRLGQAVSGRRLAGARALDGRSAISGLVAGHLTTLGRVGHRMAPADAPFAADLVVDLLGRLLVPATGNRRQRDLPARVLKYVESRFDAPGLTPSTIAAAFGVTPRYLHMLFAGSGTTVAAHIRNRRLARIRRDLADPRLMRRSITEIVLRWGFNDAAHASRAFRRAYGISPSDWRRQQ